MARRYATPTAARRKFAAPAATAAHSERAGNLTPFLEGKGNNRAGLVWRDPTFLRAATKTISFIGTCESGGMADALDLGFDPALSLYALSALSIGPIGTIVTLLRYRAISIVHIRPVPTDSSAKVALKSLGALLCLARGILHPVRALKSLILLVEMNDFGAALANDRGCAGVRA
jgi:hypothetical protein